MRKPSTWWRTRSLYPSQSETTVGRPAAMASTGVRPKVSWMLSERDRKMSAADQIGKRTSGLRPSRMCAWTLGAKRRAAPVKLS